MKTIQNDFGQMVCVTGLFILFATACNQSSQTSKGLSNQDRAALQQIADEDSTIVMSRNWDVLVTQYSQNAVRMPPNMPTVEGRQAIRKFLDQYPPITNFSFHLVDLQGDSEFAYMRATYNITFTLPDSSSATDRGKILVVLGKEADGSWLRVADAWNSDIPPAK